MQIVSDLMLRTCSSSPANAKPRVGRRRSRLNLPDETKPLSNYSSYDPMKAAVRQFSLITIATIRSKNQAKRKLECCQLFFEAFCLACENFQISKSDYLRTKTTPRNYQRFSGLNFR
jgi:CxxC motif-containing protein (DUF1111 family)